MWCLHLKAVGATLYCVIPFFRVFPKLPERGRRHRKSSADYLFQASRLLIGSLVDPALVVSELQILSKIQVSHQQPTWCDVLCINPLRFVSQICTPPQYHYNNLTQHDQSWRSVFFQQMKPNIWQSMRFTQTSLWLPRPEKLFWTSCIDSATSLQSGHLLISTQAVSVLLMKAVAIHHVNILCTWTYWFLDWQNHTRT